MEEITMDDQTLPQWRDYIAIMAEAERLLEQSPTFLDSQQRQELYRLMFAAITTGYHSAFADAGQPDFVPAVSNILNTIGANPDFIYAYTPLDGEGVYRLSGRRGNEVFILIDLTAGGFGVIDEFGPSVGVIDLDKFTLDSQGRFDVILSARRPDAYNGDWFEIAPATKTATLRKAYYHWGNGEETRIAIERLDGPLQTGRLEASEVARRLTLLSAYINRYVSFILGYGQRQRQQGYVNSLEHDDWAGRGGIAGQHYYQGIFELQPGEAMIIETALPDRVRYWNIQVNDPLWNTIDWFNHQSSLNGGQAELDADGKFRAVISVEDPGVPNWLDTGGHLVGSLMLRWTEASSGPEPTLKIVPMARLREHLPDTTPAITPAERNERLRERRRGAQLRRRW
jgi:Protein of unknown function (DUF1214)